jgi:hypothetical protein
MEHMVPHRLRGYVAPYLGRFPTLTFSHLDRFLAMAFAQHIFRESLRDIESSLRAH